MSRDALHRRFVVWPVALVLLLIGLLAGCSREPPEQALRAVVGEIQAAIEARDTSSLTKHMADDFIGPEGLDKAGTRRMAQGLFLRYRDVDVALGPAELSIDDRHATVRLKAVLAGGQGRMLPDAASVYDVASDWRLEDDEWQLTGIRWNRRL